MIFPICFSRQKSTRKIIPDVVKPPEAMGIGLNEKTTSANTKLSSSFLIHCLTLFFGPHNYLNDRLKSTTRTANWHFYRLYSLISIHTNRFKKNIRCSSQAYINFLKSNVSFPSYAGKQEFSLTPRLSEGTQESQLV